MAEADVRADFDRLTTAEKVLHVQDLWDRIAASAARELELTEAQRSELDQRLEAHRAALEQGSSWAEVRDRIRSRR